jgi:PAS domain S-box-containing protein
VLLTRQQAALRDSEARLAGMIESAMDAIVSVDAEQRVVLFNRAAETLFRCPRADALGQHLERFMPERFRPGSRRLAADAARTGLTARIMAQPGTCGLRSDGEEFPIEASLSACRVAGRDLYTLILRDVTERKRAEDERRSLDSQLRQAQKMEAIGRLGGGVAHDFNNMLNVILGHAELALRTLSPVDPVQGNLQAICDAALRSADLTRRLLAFSRPQAVAPRVIDLNAQLKGLEGLLQRMIGEDVALEFVLSEEVWPVSLDPSQVDQTVANLAVNSRDAMPKGGKLIVETANVTLDEAYCRHRTGARPGDYVMLAVSDSGCGMDEATRERAFEPFFTTKPEGKGTGLGLSTVYGIVKQNEGVIEIYSELGHGTTLKVYLPRYRGEEKVQAAAPPTAALARGHETVLLVEDQDQVRELTRTLLEELGYRVHEAARPGDAITLCEKHGTEIALLVTDVVMPTMNGKELARRIEAMRPGIRTLFTSGYTPEAIARRGVLEPGVHFLEKPFTMEALARKVREVLGTP